MSFNSFLCPFCGNTATVEQFYIDNNDWFQCVCLSCGEPSFFFEKAEDAVKAWLDEANARHSKIVGVINEK